MYLYKTIIFILNIIFRLFYKIEVIGKENIPKENGYLLCSNHTHILDPIILSMIVPRHINWMGKKELFENKFLAYFFRKLGGFPVDREETGLSTIKHSIKLLRNQELLGIFPEGGRVTEFNLENAKAGVPLISIKSKSPILPIYIEGSYKPFNRVKIYIGEDFDFSESYGERLGTNDYKVYGEEILKRIYSIKSELEEL